MATIEDARKALAEALAPILAANLPQAEGYQIRLEIIENGRKTLGFVSCEDWKAASGEIRIKFGPVAAPGRHAFPGATGGAAEYDESGDREYVYTEQDYSDLARALHDVEKACKPAPVPLEHFLDSCLPALDCDWCKWRGGRVNAVRRGIEDGIIFPSWMPDPDSPESWVKGLRLNNSHPFVVKVLYGANRGLDDFKPMEIRGEPLSETIIRNRGWV